MTVMTRGKGKGTGFTRCRTSLLTRATTATSWLYAKTCEWSAVTETCYRSRDAVQSPLTTRQSVRTTARLSHQEEKWCTRCNAGQAHRPPRTRHCPEAYLRRQRGRGRRDDDGSSTVTNKIRARQFGTCTLHHSCTDKSLWLQAPSHRTPIDI